MQIFNNLVIHLSPALAVPDPWSNFMKRNLQFDSFSKLKIKVLLSTWNLGLHVLSSRMTMTSWSLTSGESKAALITVFDLSSRSQMISFLKQGEMDCFDRSNHHLSLSPALSDSNPDPWSKSNEGPTWTTPWWWGGYKTRNRLQSKQWNGVLPFLFLGRLLGNKGCVSSPYSPVASPKSLNLILSRRNF